VLSYFDTLLLNAAELHRSLSAKYYKLLSHGVCLCQAAGAAGDTRLKPNPINAEKAVAQALRSTYEDEHGHETPPALIYKNYDCTKTVPVLPPRMAIHSDSCSLWRKSGHVEDE